jgi:hypothetical protein
VDITHVYWRLHFAHFEGASVLHHELMRHWTAVIEANDAALYSMTPIAIIFAYVRPKMRLIRGFY